MRVRTAGRGGGGEYEKAGRRGSQSDKAKPGSSGASAAVSSGGDTFVTINNYGGNAEGIADFVRSNSFIDAFKQADTEGAFN